MQLSDFVSYPFKPVILEYRIKDPKEWLNLKHKVFQKDSLRWKEHVFKWRQITEHPPEWSWTYGPVADGGLNTGEYYKIKAIPDMDQLAVHDEKQANINLELLNILYV
ncbi:hypothetical protein GLN3_13170 [Geobacillus lituanicus]|nr:hypothetical protein GLN3_13170 [Geobacillus lituanicus]